MSKSATAVDLKALVEALERRDIYAAQQLLHIHANALYPVTEAIRSAYIGAGVAVANDLPLRIRATFGFGGNPRAVTAVQQITGEFITRIVEAQREATRDVVTALVNEGIPARTAALSIVGKINPATGIREGGYLGLDAPRANQAAKVAAMLRDPDAIKDYFIGGKPRYKTTDRRFDKMVRDAIASGKGLTKEQADKITKAHRARLLKNRGDTVARNEGLNALRKGERDGFQELVDSGAVPDSRIVREWIPTKDARTRQDHVAMAGQTHRGMGTPFTFPDGHMALFPGDVSLGAGPEDTIMCRCMMSYRIARPRAQ